MKKLTEFVSLKDNTDHKMKNIFWNIAMQFKKPSGFLGTVISSLMIKGNRHEYDALIVDLDMHKGEKILEIGYGPGIGIELIAKEYDSCIIYGVDFSELMYKRATKRNKSFIDDLRVKLLFGDFLQTEIHANNFNKIFCLNVIYFWDDLKQPFEKIRLLLKNGGTFCFYMAKKEDLSRLKFTPDDVFNKYTIEQVVDALNLAGFSNIDFRYERGYYVKAIK
jgi:ubiquinone/menaquinone biosynthesis C-methylase UbiE